MQSIPRLELQAAVIGARLAKSIAENHSLRIIRRVFWTDSATVLSWIHSDHRRYRQYVAFRISEILSLSSESEWRYVPSRMNVADDATKWKPENYSVSSRWFKAPEFLYKNENKWPVKPTLVQQTNEEIRSVNMHQATEKSQLIDLSRFSKFERLHRAMAYVHRFITICRRKTPSITETNGLTRDDLCEAEVTLWKLAQSEVYQRDISILQICNDTKGRSVLEKNSPIYKLSPCLNTNGVIVKDSRILYALCVPMETRQPVILPNNHPVTQLLVDWYHRRFGHSCNETVVNELRQRYHISNLRVVVRKTAKRCTWCLVYKSKTAVPRMAPLPPARVTPYVRPFSFVGLDYCGPFIIRQGRVNVKRYVALFTCLTIRAVHLEVAHSLSTESCKLAIRRFICKRGAPQEVYSDQGTNFQGTSRELAEEIRNINKNLASTFTNTDTQWNFNPPAAPHMGGAWERMVRSIKCALLALGVPRKPDDEAFVTVISEAESMVNSRPLTYLPLDSEEQTSLTPNHFLLLNSSGVVQPVKQPVDERAVLKSSWNTVQSLLDQFWRRWIREYLPTIADRSKWHAEARPVAVGDLVVVVDEAARNSWTRGRVVRVYKGKDGRIRSADIQTSHGSLQRPVSKIAVLDLSGCGMAGLQKESNTQQYGAGDVEDDHREDGNRAQKAQQQKQHDELHSDSKHTTN